MINCCFDIAHCEVFDGKELSLWARHHWYAYPYLAGEFLPYLGNHLSDNLEFSIHM
ncbi:hypothetical protein HanIR_Chr17g0869101 [Helianthus annuus]|nr:hypothetical protein HanIR_Chr17g0869101 [Helianthus annuus]